MATSAPVPMAMPRSAWASAGASLMPSPTIATRRPRGLQRPRSSAALSAGSTSARTCSGGMPTARRDGLGRAAGASPVSSHDLDARAASASATASRGLGLDRIGDRRCSPASRAVDGDEDRASAAAAARRVARRPARRGRRRGRRRRARPGAARCRRATRCPSTRRRRRRGRPAAANALDRAGSRARRACRGATIASPSGCSLPRSAAAARSSSSVASAAGAPRTTSADRRPAAGQRAGLVEDDRVDALGALERLAAPDQDAGLGAAAGADHDRRRRRQAHRARAGDDQRR